LSGNIDIEDSLSAAFRTVYVECHFALRDSNREMPNHKQQRKGTRRNKGRQAISGLTNVRVGLPDRLRVTMTYGTYVVLAPGAGGTASQSFRANSLFDPDFTGVGTTAFPYSKLSLLYNRYRVVRSRIWIEGVNTGTTPITYYLTATIVNSVAATENELGGRHTARGTAAPGGPISWKHKASATTAAIFGVPPSQVMSEDDFAAIVGGNPNNVWYYHVLAFNNSAGTSGATTVNVRIEFDTFWSMPLNLAP